MEANKFGLYRKIRYDRTYRTLGKMSWWRVALGVALLLLVLLMTGVVSRPFVQRGDFRTAERLLVFPAWMETYRPTDKAFLDAGVLFQDGDYEAALAAFRDMEHDSAPLMRSRAALALAEQRLAAGDLDGARAAADEADPTLLSEGEAARLSALLASLGQ